MKIRTRLSLLFVLITAGLLAAFAGVVYWQSEKNRGEAFYHQLEKEARTRASLVLEAAMPDTILHQIYRNNRQYLNEVEVAMYRQPFELLYHDDLSIDQVKETPEMLAQIAAETALRFETAGMQVCGLRIEHNEQVYLITAAAYDEQGHGKLQALRKLLLWAWFSALLFIFGLGYYFSYKALQPVADMIDKAKRIGANKMNLRLSSAGEKDELSELAQTFNQMLDRLENSFEAQRQFVSNISHELRTPLSALISELELGLDAARDEAERELLQRCLSDARRMARLSNSLLDLAKASYDRAAIRFEAVRVDELLLEAASQLQRNQPGHNIQLYIDESAGEESEPLVEANAYLLRVACMNLMDNACKFDPQQRCIVRLLHEKQQWVMRFTDEGPGIAAEELDRIFKPFERGSNAVQTPGSGIGLALSHKIVQLHGGLLRAEAAAGRGSVFSISLPDAFRHEKTSF
ncbi:MAG: sensor histidine kinase [Bacteroidia bacterium]